MGGTFVYLAIDNRHNTGGRPSWLDASYVDQGFDLTVSEGTNARPYNVYRKPVTAGSTVALPRIGSAAAPCYLVVVQDTRGRFSSEGEFYPLVYEAEDGYDAVEWAAGLPGSR